MSSLKRDQSSTSDAPAQYGGNGSGYDGKIFVHLNDGTACADGSLFDAKLEGRAGNVYLIRKNCADIPAALQAAVQVETTPLSPTIVIYEGRVYHERILLIDDFAAGVDNSRFLAGNGFTVDAAGKLNGTVGVLARYKADGTPDWMKTGAELGSSFKNFGTLPSGDFAMVATRLDGTGAVYKLNAAGAPQWAKALARGTAFQNTLFWFSSVTSDTAGNIYMAGGLEDSFSKSAVASLVKLDPNGNLLWVRTIIPLANATAGPAPHSQSSEVSVVSATGVFFKGNLKGISFVARFNADGAFYWVKSFPGYKPGAGVIHRADHTTLLALNDTTSSLMLEMNGLGVVTSAKRLLPPAGFTSVFVSHFLLTPRGDLMAMGNLATATQKAGFVFVRDATGTIKSQWKLSVGGYTALVYPRLGPDGIVWAQAHVPFAGGALLTGIMVRFDPKAAAPVCPFCSSLSLQINAETPPTPVDNERVFVDQFLTVTPGTVPVFTDVPPGTFAF